MAANTVTSSTGTVSGADPGFVVAYRTRQSNGVMLYIKYTAGATAYVRLTFDVLNTSLHATDKYRHTSLTGTSLGAYTIDISASGNYRIPIPVIFGETTVYANVTFSGAGLDGAAVVNIMES